jgi:hypothetical protein
VGGLKSPTSDSEIEAGLIVPELGKEYAVDPKKTCMTSLNMGFATLFLHATITKFADTTTGKERPWLMFSDIRTNPRYVKINRIMKENVDKSVITRDMISLIFYEEAPTIGVFLTDMIVGTKVVPNFLAGPITLKRISHMKEVREKVVHVLNIQPEVKKEAWLMDRDYYAMISNLKIVLDKKPVEGTSFKRELMLWNEVIMVTFRSVNDSRPQELLRLVLLHVYNDTHQ